MNRKWCDEAYPELEQEVRQLYIWIAKDKNTGEHGEDIDKALQTIIEKVKKECVCGV